MSIDGRPRRTSDLPATSHGSSREAFTSADWGLLAGIAAIWGSSFLFMAEGLDAFQPGVVTLARIGLGTLALALIPGARAPIERTDRARVALLGVVWFALPLILFPIAQQWIDSSVAGMINGAVPITTAVWATALLRALPGRRQLLGIAIGFAGVATIFLPELQDSSATALGAGLILVAVTLYGLAANMAVPLQHRYGALPVLLRAQLVALVLVTPPGLLQISGSSWAWSSALAMLPLGMLGTGLAFVLMTTLVGRVGGTRGAIAIYFVPIFAVTLGVVIRGEAVHPLSLLGTALVLVGAWFTSRREA